MDPQVTLDLPRHIPPAQFLQGLLMIALLLGGLAALGGLLVRACLQPPDAHVCRQRLRFRTPRASDFWALLAGLLVMNVLLILGVRLWTGGAEDRLAALQGPLAVAQTLALQGAALVWVSRVWGGSRTRWRRRFGLDHRWLRDLLHGLWGYAAAAPLVIAAALGWRYLLMRWGVDVAPQDLIKLIAGDPTGWLARYLLFVAVVLAPLSEELVFRGLALPLFSRQAGVAAGVTASALLFALLHMNVNAFAPIFVFGLALGMAYVVTGQLRVPIVMHMAFNGVNLILLLQSQDLLRAAA
jgi:membrane protease YdiL (CAAX protease family)